MTTPADTAQAAHFELRDDLPDGEILVPIDTTHGLVMAIRRGEMSPALCDAMNRASAHLFSVLWRRE